MKRFFMSAAVALLVAFGFASAPAEAGTISLLDSTFAQPGGQGAGDTTHAQQIDQGSFEVSHQFGSKNTTFVDTFKFSVNGIKTAFNLDIKLFGTVDNITVQLLDHNYNPVLGTGGSPLITLISLSKAGGSPDPMDSFFKYTGTVLASIVAEPFVFLKVTGKFCSCGKYVITATPVPPALLMFLTALGGMAFAGFWRARGAGLSRAA